MTGGVNPPAVAGLLAWTNDPWFGMNNGYQVIFGYVFLAPVVVPSTITVANCMLLYSATATGAGCVNSFVGIYASDGVLVATSADFSALVNVAAPKWLTIPISATLSPGVYYVGVLVGASSTGTAPSFQATNRVALSDVDGQPPAPGVVIPPNVLGFRFAHSSPPSTYDALPSPIPQTAEASTPMIWFGLL